MPWLAAVGVFVAAAVGVEIAAAGLAAMVIGGMVVGAAVGGLYSAITGGSILKGVLYGALGGAVIGGGAFALGLGSAGAGAGGTVGTATVGEVTGGGLTAVGSTTVGGMSATLGAETGVTAGVLAQGAATTGGGLFTTGNVAAVGAVASLGEKFLAGGAAGEMAGVNAEIEREKIAATERIATAKNATDIEQARIAAGRAGTDNSYQERIAGNELAEKKRQFDSQFAEEKWRDRKDRMDKEKFQQEVEAGSTAAAKYVAGATSTASVAESSRRRRELPGPTWYERSAPKTQQPQPVAA